METNTGTEEVSEEKKNETRADEEKKGAESTEEVGKSDKVGTSGNGGRVKEDTVEQKIKAKT